MYKRQGHRYLFYIYLDKTGRLAATTDIDQYLTTDHNYNIGDSVEGIVYGFQTNNSAMAVSYTHLKALPVKFTMYLSI